MLNVPMVAVSLVDADRQWFTAMWGLPTRQTSRDVSFCGHAILQPQAMFMVSDTHADARFVDNPLVTGEPHIRFYAGVPLLSSNDLALGSLCVLDSVPRQLTTDDEDLLKDLALLVQAELRAMESGSLEFEVRQRRAAELEARTQERRIASLYEVAAAPQQDAAQVLRNVIELGCRELGLESGALSRIRDGNYVVEAVLPSLVGFSPGTVFPLDQMFCSVTVATQQPVLCAKSSTDARFQEHPSYLRSGVEAHAGAPVVVDGELYGTLVFWSQAERSEPFTPADSGFLALMARLVSSVLERRELFGRLNRAREEAVAAANAKNTFLANVSHELRTPMNAVLGMNRLVLDTQLDPAQRELISDATTAAGHLLKLLDDVLDFSRHEAQEVRLELNPFSFDTLMHDTLRSLSPLAHRSGVELLCDVSAEVPPLLLGDPCRISQVVRNLVGNALKFTSVGSVRVRVSGAPSADGEQFVTTLRVEDTGMGIASADLQRIFEPFTQRDGSSSRRYGGTGLGLSIVERLVEAMSGELSVESTVGVGSTFSATLALGLVADAPRRVAPASSNLSRALLVDGHPDGRMLLKGLLHEHGIVCEGVDSIAEARALLSSSAHRQEPFTQLFLDEHLRGEDVWAFGEEVAQQSLQVVMLASSEDRVALERRVSNVPGALSLWKPVTRPGIRSLLERRVTSSARQERTPAATARVVAARSLRVLVAEDNPLNQKLLGLLLERMGHHVHVVSSGREAVRAVSDEDYDVVLMDIQMPDIDGMAASRAIRVAEFGTGQRTPIVAVTASALDGDRERFLAEGLDGYIPKPIDAALLTAVLEDVALRLPQLGSQVR